MNRAMFAGVAGLKTHQTKMDVIGNNIANVNTYGYKSQRAVFADLMYQSIRGASAGSASRGGTNPSSVGYGSSLAGIQSQMTTSSMQSTGFGLDVAITGEGFLQVMDGDGNIFYTKAGMLDYDSQGYLTDINGNFVLGSPGKDGKPGSEKIRLDNIGAVDPKKPLAEKEVNGVKYKIEASNASKYGNVGITLGSSEDLPAGLKAKATISTTGAILVQLNAFEKFDSMTDLNNAINAAITEANDGKPHAAGTFTVSSDKNVFGKDAAGGSFAGNATSNKGTMTGGTADADGNPLLFNGALVITDFSGVKEWPSPATGLTFTVTEPTAGTLTVTTTIGGNTFTATVAKNAGANADLLFTGAPAGGTFKAKLPAGKSGSDLAVAIGTPDNTSITANPPVTFLGGATITTMGSKLSGNGDINFSIAEVTGGTGFPMKLTATVGGKVYEAQVTSAGGSVVLKTQVGGVDVPDDTITINIPSAAKMKENMGLATTTTDAQLFTALQGTVARPANHNYTATAATAAAPRSLTGAEIAGAAGGVNLGGLDLGSATLVGGAMTFKKASAGFTGTGPVQPVEAKYTAAAGGEKAFWEISATINGKQYTAKISEDTVAGSILLKANGTSDTDYIEMSNPGFAAINDFCTALEGGGAIQPAHGYNLIKDGTITAKPTTKSNNLGLGDNFALAGGTEGGAITLDELSSISIGSDGTVTVSHPDKGVVVAGKISLANFANAGGLQQMGNNYYSVSANSGEAKLCDPGSDGTGALKSSALEMSNVDLSGEFADMITTQRGFQANSRIITVSDTMLEELINLKR